MNMTLKRWIAVLFFILITSSVLMFGQGITRDGFFQKRIDAKKSEVPYDVEVKRGIDESLVDYAMRVALTYQDAYHELWLFAFGEEGLETAYLLDKRKWEEHITELKKKNNSKWLVGMTVDTLISFSAGYILNEVLEAR